MKSFALLTDFGRISRRLSIVGLFLTGTALMAQLTLSTIRGTATDPSGAAVANTEVTVTNLETNEKRTVVTNDKGDFEIPDLYRGSYRLTATQPGFKTFVADNIILEGQQIRRVDITFELGSVGTEVTVSAGAAVIQTDSSKLQGSLNTTKHFDTPWVGAEATLDPSLFITTLPLVNQTDGQWSSQWAGQSSSQVQEGQDGHTNDGPVNQLNDIMDTQEITIVTVNNSAEFSRVGYMNMVTKSGSNAFHGRAAFWHQNSALGAREFFEDTKAKQLVDTASASISGPIKRDKAWFFASVNFLKVPSKQFYLRTVPTDLMRQGNFSELLSQAKPVILKDPSTGDPFPGNIIPNNRLNPLSLKVNEKYLPPPNRPGLANNFGFTFPFPTDYSLRKDFTQRVDWQATNNNRLMGRVIENWDLYVLPKNYPAFSWTRVRYNIHTVVEDTHVFSPAMVNTFRLGLYQEKVTDGDPLYGVTPFKGDQAVKELGLQGVNPKGYSAQGFPIMSISGYAALQTQAGGVRQNDFDWGYADTLTWSKGRHVIKAGGEWKPQHRFSGAIPDNSYGSFSFNGSFTGQAYGDFLLGIPLSSTRLDPLTNRTQVDRELGLFVTDSFKVNSRLTLDLGLRWERFGPPRYEDNLVYNFDLASQTVLIPTGTENQVSPLYPKTIKVATGDIGFHPKKTNFRPRVGLAYRLDNRTVVRGSFGVFSEYLGRYIRLSSSPFQISETYQNQIVNGAPVFAFPNPFPSSIASAGIPSQGVTAYPSDIDNGRIEQWNVTIERQYKDIGFRLSYIGSHNYNLNYSVGINKPAPSLIPFTPARRPYPQFNAVSVFRTDAQAKFNAMTFEVQRKLGQFTFDTHWTWSSNFSKSIGEDPFGPLMWARDTFTPRHRVVLNAVWELPFGKGRKYMANAPRIADGVLGGWQIYWIGYLETGHWFTPSFSGSDPSNTNTIGGRPDRVCDGSLPSSQRSIDHWFDTSCFVVPPQGRFGNSGGNFLEGPGYNMQHASIAKTFNITERWKFTFTAALANAFNHPNFTLPAANVSSTSAGFVSDLVEGARARHIELRGRIDF